jgi:hypothetical protein
MFSRQEKSDGCIKISGLNKKKSAFGVLNWKKKTSNGCNRDDNDEENLPESTIMIRLSGNSTSEETTETDSGGKGERIVTTKSTKELARIVKRLQLRLATKEVQIKQLEEKVEEYEVKLHSLLPTPVHEEEESKTVLDIEIPSEPLLMSSTRSSAGSAVEEEPLADLQVRREHSAYTTPSLIQDSNYNLSTLDEESSTDYQYDTQDETATVTTASTRTDPPILSGNTNIDSDQPENSKRTNSLE